MLLTVIAILAGFVLLVWGADRFVLGAGAMARNIGVSPLLIGLTIVGFATSAPEIMVSAIASLRNNPGLAIGNAIGSNIANIGLVLGATALVRPMRIQSETLRREIPALLAVTLLSVMLFLDNYISRTDGVVLLLGLGLLLHWMAGLGFRSAAGDPMSAEYAAEIPADVSTPTALAWFLLGLAVLLSGAWVLVWGAIKVAHVLNVSDLIIGLTVVAVGTSLPELAVSIVAAMKGEHDLAFGNIIGSNMFNLLAVIGVAASLSPISPIRIDAEVLILHLPVMVGLTLVIFAIAYNFGGRGRVFRVEGFLLLMSFVAYQVYIIKGAMD
ncbi:MAG: calcium/sodium antiporter [Proteobacteria bacterium]|nr:calcium/sodium antiporter [Pseudomonadota bacterium]MCZ6686941.1 calcium/sodium antiporter [Gammaproteobacteria bacterium]MCZ6879687.1 calcium/sodium antiporter [Gammaproteobacteria bacterium]